ncbi:hypothetical protein GKQ38_04775 [Candidatus Nanohaloarchaea archaeon]|nr:hypothetical protein GKQ38_04775 [Candidatus Nanohaloarchaea archaeon]
MSDGSEGSKEKTVSVRDTPENVDITYELLEDSDMSMSDFIRTSMELYREDEDFRQGINSYWNNEVDSLTDFYDSEEEALEDLAGAVQEEAEYLDPEHVDSALTGLMEGLYSRDREQVSEAAKYFGAMDPDLGVTVAWGAGKFAEDYWEDSSK